MSKTEQAMFFIFAVIMVWELFKFSVASLKEWIEYRLKFKPLRARLSDDGKVVIFSGILDEGVRVTVERDVEVPK